MSALDSMPPDPHPDGRALLAAIGVPDADSRNVDDTSSSVGAYRRLPNGTFCEVRRRRWGGECRLDINRTAYSRRFDVPTPDQLLGPYLMARRDDEAAGGQA